MSDWLRDLDPYARIAMVTFLSALVSALLRQWWAGYKTRQRRLETPMKLKNGTYVPWGRVEKIEALGNFMGWLGLFHLLFWIIAVVYVRVNHIRF
jgi:hypothetical protein